MPKAKSVGEFEYVEGTSESRQILTDQVLWALHLHGPFEDRENGRATALVAEWLEEEQGIDVPKALSGVIRDLTTDDWDNYVVRDCPATRTYSISLADGIRPGKVPFPPNPFEDETVAVSTRELVADVPVMKLVPVEDESPDESRGGADALDIALQITELGALLVRELPAQMTLQRDGLPDWVKTVVDENTRLVEENRRLQLALEGAQGLADRLLPGRMEQSDDEVAVSG